VLGKRRPFGRDWGGEEGDEKGGGQLQYGTINTREEGNKRSPRRKK